MPAPVQPSLVPSKQTTTTDTYHIKESILSNLCRSGCRVTLVNGTLTPLTIIGRIEEDPRGFEYGFIVTDSTRRLVVSFTHEDVTELVLSINGNHDDPVVRILLSDATAE